VRAQDRLCNRTLLSALSRMACRLARQPADIILRSAESTHEYTAALHRHSLPTPASRSSWHKQTNKNNQCVTGECSSSLADYDSFDSATFCRQRFWLFVAYVVSFVSIIGASAMLLKHMAQSGGGAAPHVKWTGWVRVSRLLPRASVARGALQQLTNLLALRHARAGSLRHALLRVCSCNADSACLWHSIIQ
jgi:uncharacterized CHY-type Zn-finger protein